MTHLKIDWPILKTRPRGGPFFHFNGHEVPGLLLERLHQADGRSNAVGLAVKDQVQALEQARVGVIESIVCLECLASGSIAGSFGISDGRPHFSDVKWNGLSSINEGRSAHLGIRIGDKLSSFNNFFRSEERRVGKECRFRWSREY